MSQPGAERSEPPGKCCITNNTHAESVQQENKKQNRMQQTGSEVA